MPILGAHLSIAGGYYKAADAAGALAMQTVQIFTKNNNQWSGKALSDDDAARFRQSIANHNLVAPLSHSSYLINLASPNPELWNKSVEAMVVELERASRLGIDWVVLHPGAYTDGDEAAGVSRIIEALDIINHRTAGLTTGTLLETTAGQGKSIGWRFEHLASLLGGAKHPERLGVCLDTCHIFAAGYPMSPASAYEETFGRFNELIGVEQIRAFHLNDSKKELGSRVDRHEHIGRGKLGLEPFRLLLNDKRFANVPMYMETPKGMEDGRELDAINLETLRGLVGK